MHTLEHQAIQDCRPKMIPSDITKWEGPASQI
jgi:hypothetical protein